ncbi:MAG: zinc ribbon domain-containing protein [Clostridiales bacterium]|jgi:hypothetical protein|nr:zinc ribbon domain-containing protein [Clostridiales bacterium]
MKKCPNCRRPYGDDINFCGICGVSLEDGIAKCPSCGKVYDDEETVFCGACGSRLEKISAIDPITENAVSETLGADLSAAVGDTASAVGDTASFAATGDTASAGKSSSGNAGAFAVSAAKAKNLYIVIGAGIVVFSLFCALFSRAFGFSYNMLIGAPIIGAALLFGNLLLGFKRGMIITAIVSVVLFLLEYISMYSLIGNMSFFENFGSFLGAAIIIVVMYAVPILVAGLVIKKVFVKQDEKFVSYLKPMSVGFAIWFVLFYVFSILIIVISVCVSYAQYFPQETIRSVILENIANIITRNALVGLLIGIPVTLAFTFVLWKVKPSVIREAGESR